MNIQPALLGAAILFWGWQTGHWMPAVLCALSVEARRFVPRRWEFSPERLNRLGDFCAIITVALGVWLYVTLGNPRAITQLFLWLPVSYLPLALSQAYGTRRDLDLGVLVWSLRRNAGRTRMRVNFAYLYLGLWTVAASAANRRDGSFEMGLFAMAAWALWQARPRSRSLVQWLVLVPLAAGLGYAGHIGLHDLQIWLEGNTAELFSGGGGSKTDPYRADTDIGHIGSLKQSDRIVIRVRAVEKFERPLLLHRASYDSYTGLRWLAKNAPFTEVSQAGIAAWAVAGSAGGTAAGATVREVSIIEQTIHGKPVLALPAGTRRIEGLAASEVMQNALGAVQVEHRPGFVPYRALYVAGTAEAVAPRADDLALPKREAEAFNRIAQTLGLKAMAPAEAAQAVKKHFATGFAYSLYQPDTKTIQPPLVEFIERTRAGHCEYFASATALLLRAGGIPARYATGFSVQEWSEREDAYVVRTRHAHSWVRAWIDGAWREIDTTPAAWAEIEGEATPWWSGVPDGWSWLRLRFFEWQSGKSAASAISIAVAVILALWIGWRLFGKPSIKAASSATIATRSLAPGQDSPFYRIEQCLAAQGWQRTPQETSREWLRRVGPHLLQGSDDLAVLLYLHYRCRFDPRGLPPPELDAFSARVDEWLAASSGPG